MKKIIALGDTHGRTIWKDIVAKENPDTVIFIGDYLDSFDISGDDQLNNLLDILEYKKSSGKEVILLIGNHDFHYMDCAFETYSGYQKGKRFVFNALLEDNMDKFQICHRISNLLFSHAGISKTWLTNCLEKEDWINDESITSIEKFIQELWKHKPRYFSFNGKDSYGNDVTQGPLWIRPQSLYVDRIENFTQIVGHTTVKHINPPKEDSQFYLIDALEFGKEYLEILLEEDNTYKINIKSL